MKKYYSIFVLFALMLAALGFFSCGGDDEEAKGNGNSNDNGAVNGDDNSNDTMTLTIDDVTFYSVNSSVQQTKLGIYLTVQCATRKDVITTSGHELVMRISPNTVALLNVGDVFDSSMISVQKFRRLNEITVNNYAWNVLEGCVTIIKITEMEMTIQIDGLLLEHQRTSVQHSISGMAVLNSGVYDNDGNLLSFAEVIE